MKRSEFQLINYLKKTIPRQLKGKTGIGDDAAVFWRSRKDHWLVTTDVIVDGIDFKRQKAKPELIGRKALAVNLSDIAAMGGAPQAFVVTLGLPDGIKDAWLGRCYRGMMKLAKKYGVSCVGGDISRSSRFFLSVTLIGRSSGMKPICRNGAKPGDRIAVTGRLGGSIRGHHFSFEPRLREGALLARRFRPSSMIDISDGLCQDLEHVLRASKVSASIDLESIPVSDAARRIARGRSAKAITHALSDGEDFELLFTVSPGKAEKLERLWKKIFPRVRLSWIGNIESGSRGIQWRRGGQRAAGFRLRKAGFTHF
ncbi:MAG: thiamine-phosphate kinase [Candidatus Omnitrophota bacterium]|nr:thiamine-phosphate kinase [Candidatus Omnitrophota bacterium]